MANSSRIIPFSDQTVATSRLEFSPITNEVRALLLCLRGKGFTSEVEHDAARLYLVGDRECIHDPQFWIRYQHVLARYDALARLRAQLPPHMALVEMLDEEGLPALHYLPAWGLPEISARLRADHFRMGVASEWIMSDELSQEQRVFVANNARPRAAASAFFPSAISAGAPKRVLQRSPADAEECIESSPPLSPRARALAPIIWENGLSFDPNAPETTPRLVPLRWNGRENRLFVLAPDSIDNLSDSESLRRLLRRHFAHPEVAARRGETGFVFEQNTLKLKLLGEHGDVRLYAANVIRNEAGCLIYDFTRANLLLNAHHQMVRRSLFGR